ncbi:regulatory protein, luxR family [Salegentibacter holothuriorum]|uniref:Regulatory protein, luxR family n=1 Tax=Salegentibacter holothuriorum TaxID=241145 RepID=A0A1T5D7Q3_9FLAO|nr:LuxR C-terminal-related transcriptional regulator [Salegentibacter holothuriorum]SKB67699.1 regulatory protein, luxR family [Salegentibacter holothuriorum]
MSVDFNSIAHYWKETYSQEGENAKKYEHSAQFKRMVDFMAPGKSYYYIANFQSLEIEMISDSVCDYIDKDSVSENGVKFQEILDLALPEEIEKIKRKEQVIRDFFIDFIPREKVQSYKVLYTYVLKDYQGNRKVMLQQATPLSQDSKGRFIHVFSIHTDISHLTNQSVEEVSFLNIRGGKSYLNVATVNGKFEPQRPNEISDITALLSKRELEITKLLAEGLNADEIGERLFISTHTVRTHRKNILKKTNSKNTIQLVARSIAAGLITPNL